MNTPHAPTAGRHPADALLAAFVDGRLGGAEHRRLVEHLAGCEVCREVVAETAKTLDNPELASLLDDDGDGGEEDAEPASSGRSGKVLRPKKSRFRRGLPLFITLGAAAAVAALLVLTPTGRGILGLGGAQSGLKDLTAGLDGEVIRDFFVVPVDGNPGYEDYEQGWDVLQGDTAPALDAETSFQLGVQVSYLEGALMAQEAPAATTLVARIHSKIEPLPVAPLLYRDLVSRIDRDANFESLRLLHARAEQQLRLEGEHFHLAWYELGRWAAVARLATESEEESWAEQPSPRRELRRLRREEWPPAVAGPLEAVAGLTADGIASEEWPELAGALSALIAAGGNHDDWPAPSDPTNEPAI